MANNTIQSTKFYLTSRAGEQLAQTAVKMNKGASTNPFAADEYVSTVEQDNIEDKRLSKAYKNRSLAAFTLNGSSAVNNFNAYMRKVQLSEKLNEKLA